MILFAVHAASCVHESSAVTTQVSVAACIYMRHICRTADTWAHLEAGEPAEDRDTVARLASQGVVEQAELQQAREADEALHVCWLRDAVVAEVQGLQGCQVLHVRRRPEAVLLQAQLAQRSQALKALAV